MEFLIGSPYALIGDPTVAAGAGLFDLGQIIAARITIGGPVVRATDRQGRIHFNGAARKSVQATVELEVEDVQRDVLEAFFANAMDVTGAATGIGFRTVASGILMRTLIVVPEPVFNAGTSDTAPIWIFPAVDNDGDSTLPMEDTEGDEANRTFSSNFRAMYTEVDQEAQSIKPECRIVARTPLSSVITGVPTSPWSLPAAY